MGVQWSPALGEQDIKTFEHQHNLLSTFVRFALGGNTYINMIFKWLCVCSVLPLKGYLLGFSKPKIKKYAFLERIWKCLPGTQLGAIFLIHLPFLPALESILSLHSGSLWVEGRHLWPMCPLEPHPCLGWVLQVNAHHPCLESTLGLQLVRILSFLFPLIYKCHPLHWVLFSRSDSPLRWSQFFHNYKEILFL